MLDGGEERLGVGDAAEPLGEIREVGPERGVAGGRQGQVGAERRILHGAGEHHFDNVDANEMGGAEGNVQGVVAAGQGVVVLAAGNIEDVAGAHGRLEQDRAAAGGVVVGTKALESSAGDGLIEAALVNAPNLFALDVQGKDFVGVEVGVEGLAAVGRAVQVGLDLGAEALFEGVGGGGETRGEGVDIVGDEGRAAAQPGGDPVGVGLELVLETGVQGRLAILSRRNRFGIKGEAQVFVVPIGRHVEQPRQGRPRHDIAKAIGIRGLDVHRLAVVIFSEEGFFADGGDDVGKVHGGAMIAGFEDDGSGVAAALRAVQERIAAAAGRAGRDAGAVTLVAVSKQQSAARVDAALAAGQRVFGENRVQEAVARWTARRAPRPDLVLHLVGPLQTNKVAQAVALFDVIESVDRPKLAARLAVALGDEDARTASCFIQVNTGEEPQKAGVAPLEVDDFVGYCRDELALPVVGLMCIPPHDEAPAPHFALLRTMAERNELANLSMGMSGDFEHAVALGATHVRVGTAVFGVRPPQR